MTGFGDDFGDEDGEKLFFISWIHLVSKVKKKVIPNLYSAPQNGDPFTNYQREAEAADEGFNSDEDFDFMDFSDFQDLENLEEEARGTPDDYDTDSFYQMEENKMRQMADEEGEEKTKSMRYDLKAGGPNKRLMTRDAWNKSQEPTEFQAEEEESGNGRHKDMEKEAMKAKVKKTKRKSSAWEDFVDENDLDEDTQPWTPVTSPQSHDDEDV